MERVKLPGLNSGINWGNKGRGSPPPRSGMMYSEEMHLVNKSHIKGEERGSGFHGILCSTLLVCVRCQKGGGVSPSVGTEKFWLSPQGF